VGTSRTENICKAIRNRELKLQEHGLHANVAKTLMCRQSSRRKSPFPVRSSEHDAEGGSKGVVQNDFFAPWEKKTTLINWSFFPSRRGSRTRGEKLLARDRPRLLEDKSPPGTKPNVSITEKTSEVMHNRCPNRLEGAASLPRGVPV